MSHSIPNAMHVFLNNLSKGQANALIGDANQGYAVEIMLSNSERSPDGSEAKYYYWMDMGDVELDVCFTARGNDITADFELHLG